MYGQFSNLYINYYYGGHTRLGAGWGEKNAVCPYNKAYFITHGECEIVADGQVYRGISGDFFMIPAGTKHSFYHINENYITKYWFHFDARAGDENIFHTVHIPYCINFSQTKKLIPIFKSIFKNASSDNASSQLFLNAKILELLSIYLDAAGTSAAVQSTEKPDIINRLLEYINENIDKNISVAELSEIAHFHPNYLVRFFKERMGVPPVKYINGVKLEKAKSMLENTHMPIKDIMRAVGFDDYSHFSKFFKTYSGYSPKAFRSCFSKL